MNSERPVLGFATVCCLGPYQAITAELLEAVLESRLYERMESMQLAVLGAPEARRVVEEMIRPHEKITIGYASDDVAEYEFPALGLLQDSCRSGGADVFYVHTKGASHPPTDQHARYWRALMVDHVIRRHEECLGLLRDHDTAGTNWRWGSHYSGNFWWARSEHVARLPDIRRLRSQAQPISADPVWNLRLQCEFWLGIVPPRPGNLGVRDLDLYQTFRWGADVADILNEVVAAVCGDRYAELVLPDGSYYLERVHAATRHSYLSGAGWAGPERYDVVLVDGWHDEEACAADMRTAFRMLDRGGAVVVHDTNPPTAWHERAGSEYVPGSEWNGTAWRAIRRFRREHPDVWVRTVDVDWGCTVIIPGLPGLPYAEEAAGDADGWEWLDRHREGMLGLVSQSRFRRLLHSIPFARGRRALTTRTDVLNCLVSHHELDRYLEIGVFEQANFRDVIAPVRHGVDPRGATFPVTSDEFFASGRGCDQYDLVFIDGLHEEEQVLRDTENALSRLSAKGWIVLHDANPPTAWHQRPRSEFVEGEEWNGTVWRAVVRFRALHRDLCVVTLDLDWGCTVIHRGPSPTPAPEVPDPLTWEAFASQHAELLNLRRPSWEELTAIACTTR